MGKCFLTKFIYISNSILSACIYASEANPRILFA